VLDTVRCECPPHRDPPEVLRRLGIPPCWRSRNPHVGDHSVAAVQHLLRRYRLAVLENRVGFRVVSAQRLGVDQNQVGLAAGLDGADGLVDAPELGGHAREPRHVVGHLL